MITFDGNSEYQQVSKFTSLDVMKPAGAMNCICDDLSCARHVCRGVFKLQARVQFQRQVLVQPLLEETPSRETKTKPSELPMLDTVI